MNLYLSRLSLNPFYAPALKLAADPYELHRRILDTLPCGPEPKPSVGNQAKTADLLFRVDASDAGPIVLVQTSLMPDWGAMELASRALRCPLQTKYYAPTFALRQRLAFRLLCQPSVRKSGQFGLKPNGKRMPGPRRACRDDEERLAWLHRKGKVSGFAIESVGLTFVDWRNTKPLKEKGGRLIESYDQARSRAFGPGNHQSLGAVRFDGVLVVTDPDSFSRAVEGGIGPGKAFGFGLLSIAPAGP